MSVINNHVCDYCGALGKCKGEWGRPSGWYSISISKEGEKEDLMDVEACCPDCLKALIDKFKLSI
jgi:hypothetical protein